jgi:multiple antibiotic resistance protein
MKKKFIEEELSTKSEIAFTPLAIPMLAGPGTISTLIGYRNLYANTSDVFSICIALILVVGLIFVILKSSQLIFKLLGSSGLNALSRIIGFFLIAIGVEQILKTILKFIH